MGVIKLICVAVIYLTGINVSSSQDKEGFVLVKKDGAISIFERWIIFPKSEPPIDAREVKGEFFFNNNMLAGLTLLQDEKKIQVWQKHVSEFKVYPKIDTTTWLEYSYHNIPWPVSDQDHLLQYSLDEIIPGKSIFLTFESKENFSVAPVRKGVTRMELSGSWRFEQLGPYKTKVTYRILSRPTGIPKWLTDPIIRSNIMTTIEEYVALLEPDSE